MKGRVSGGKDGQTGAAAAGSAGNHASGGHASGSSGFVQFTLLTVGVACIVAGTWNLPQHRETEELEARSAALEAELNVLKREKSRYRRNHDAFLHDRHYREGLLRQVSDQRLEGELTVEEWIRQNPVDPARP